MEVDPVIRHPLLVLVMIVARGFASSLKAVYSIICCSSGWLSLAVCLYHLPRSAALWYCWLHSILPCPACLLPALQRTS